MARGAGTTKQTQAGAENNQKGIPKQSKMSQNNQKSSKTIKSAAFGGAPGALRAPGIVVFDSFW